MYGRSARLGIVVACVKHLRLIDEDDGRLFRVRVLNTGEERVARYHRYAIGNLPLRFPCFADPDRPDDYLSWLHEGWGGVAIAPLRAD